MSTQRIHSRAHVAVLTILLAAFVFRVLAQLVQFYSDVAWLPPFATWAAGGLPYQLLVTIQVVIIAMALVAIRKLALGNLIPRRNWSFFLLSAGGVYFLAMAARLIAGATFLANNAWFAASLPAVFHLVLAAFVLTLGHFHRSRS